MVVANPAKRGRDMEKKFPPNVGFFLTARIALAIVVVIDGLNCARGRSPAGFLIPAAPPFAGRTRRAPECCVAFSFGD